MLIEIKGETEKLIDAFEVKAKSDGADMEHTDFALLGYSGRSVVSITNHCYDKAALRMEVVRWLYSNALACILSAKTIAEPVRLIDGEVLHLSNEGIQRIQAGRLRQ